MELRVDLLKLPGAETAILDGVEGVFIPKIPNLRVTKFRRRYYALLELIALPYKKPTKHTYRVFLDVPKEYREVALSDPRYSIRRNLRLGTADDARGGEGKAGGFVSMSDLEDLLAD